MESTIIYREIRAGEENQVCRLVEDCFNQFVAPDYGQEGRDEFFKYLNPKYMAYRLGHEHFIMVAEDSGMIIGVIEVRKSYHISLMFVKRKYQKRGIAKKLVELAVERCRQSKPDITFIEVNSSPYAVSIYERLGFTRVNAEQTVNGMRFTPMAFALD